MTRPWPTGVQGRVAAVAILVALLALVYLIGVHWWFTAPFLEARAELIELRDTEARLRATAQERPMIEERLAEVRAFEAASPEFLVENNFDLAASAMIQRLQSLVDEQKAGAACTISSRSPFRQSIEEPFLRVTIKVRMRCTMEHFAPVLHGLESNSPRLFVSDLSAVNRRQFARGGRAAPEAVDFTFDVYGFLRHKEKSP